MTNKIFFELTKLLLHYSVNYETVEESELRTLFSVELKEIVLKSKKFSDHLVAQKFFCDIRISYYYY